MGHIKTCFMKQRPASDPGCALFAGVFLFVGLFVFFLCAASCPLHGSLTIEEERAREMERGSNACLSS